MKTLEETQEQFEDKTARGLDVSILAYHPGQEYPILAEVSEIDGWRPYTFKEDGQIRERLKGGHELVEKKNFLPKDILCEVWYDDSETRYKRYSDGKGLFYNQGSTSFTRDHCLMWDNYKVIENPAQFWFGGKCPIAKGVKYRVTLRGETYWSDEHVMGGTTNLTWGHEGIDSDIIAYQILGQGFI